MSKRFDEVEHDALLLPPDSRAILADRLLESLSGSDQKRDALWAAEAEARAQQIESGEVEALQGERVMAELRDRIKR